MKSKNQETKRNLLNEEMFLAGSSDLTFCKDKIVQIPNIIIMLQDSGEAVLNINFKEYTIRANTQVTLLRNANLRLVRSSDDFKVNYLYFQSSELINRDLKMTPFMVEYIKRNPCFTHSAEQAPQLYSTMALIQYYHSHIENVHQQTILRNLMQVFLLDNLDKLIRNLNYLKKHRSTRLEELFGKYINLLHTHCTTHREVNFYADKLCITPRYLTAVTARVTGGRSAKEILDEHVIVQIKRMLYTPGTTIKDVVEQMNFPDQSFLGKYFKRHTGKTISTFMK